MGNKHPKTRTRLNSAERDLTQYRDFYQIGDNSFSGRSFASVSSHQSTYSVSRPWSRVSRRRWKESTLTLPYASSKTAWPVTQSEAYFLPDFPVSSTANENNFQVVEELARGAFGKVYKAREKQSGNVFALKVLSKAKIVKENAVRQVKDEVQIQRACGHFEFVVGCHLVWQNRKRLFIVSDFVEGGELHELLRRFCVLPVVLVRLYVAQLALTIDFLHNAGIIYRDLKPENILLNSSGDLLLTDFGLSKWLPHGARTRTLCGTLRYMGMRGTSLCSNPLNH